MKKFLVERIVPDIGNQTADDFQNTDPQVEWQETIVTDEKVFCVYLAKDEQTVRDHVSQGNLPVNKISEIKTVLTPETEHTGLYRVPEIERPVDRQLN
ncbi:nickel-binding protein [Peredibacter sp. HCB2-198]|uniref:nickel-binding protein n=1 Tax=Peredibacter sp. HCB2-198 TaxID=3383025 RepID=UPI0038B6766E